MNFKIRRRRFGQLAIISAVATAIANSISKVIAQESEQLFGVVLSESSSSKTQDLVDAVAANTTPEIILQPISLTTGERLLSTEIPAVTVSNQQESSETATKAFLVKKPSERISGFTVSSDNTFVISATATTKNGDFSRLIFIEPPKGNGKKSPKQGLKIKKTKDKKFSTVESLLFTTIKDKKGDQLLSVVSLAEGVAPFELAFIDPNSGQVDASPQTGLPTLLPNQRLSNLAKSPDGKIYATNVGGQDTTTLVQLDLENRAVVTGRGKIIELVGLSFNKKPLVNDLTSLTFSSSGQLYALADPNNEGTNSLFTVDVKTGEMTLLRKLAVDKIVFARA